MLRDLWITADGNFHGVSGSMLHDLWIREHPEHKLYDQFAAWDNGWVSITARDNYIRIGGWTPTHKSLKSLKELLETYPQIIVEVAPCDFFPIHNAFVEYKTHIDIIER